VVDAVSVVDAVGVVDVAGDAAVVDSGDGEIISSRQASLLITRTPPCYDDSLQTLAELSRVERQGSLPRTNAN
jgi:hypothetical protein